MRFTESSLTSFDKHKKKRERQKGKRQNPLRSIRCFVPKTKDTSLGMNLGVFVLCLNSASKKQKTPKTISYVHLRNSSLTSFDKHKKKRERQKDKRQNPLRSLRCFVTKTKDTSQGMNLGVFALCLNSASRK